ncbi:MAG: hypothetical protein M1831_000647 [Alyxoria varia]|nr:MAG: hypothetical protein M1831_000647 [Alyxoria varia]
MNPHGRRSRSRDGSRRDDEQNWNSRNQQGRHDSYRGRSPGRYSRRDQYQQPFSYQMSSQSGQNGDQGPYQSFPNTEYNQYGPRSAYANNDWYPPTVNTDQYQSSSPSSSDSWDTPGHVDDFMSSGMDDISLGEYEERLEYTRVYKYPQNSDNQSFVLGTHQDRRGGGRRRSRSPVPIDRYQPGRREDGPNRNDSYRRRSPPPNPARIDRYVPGQEPQGPIVNILKHPMEWESQVGFSYFAEWWRKEKEVKEERERQKTGQRRPPTGLKGEREAREEREQERAEIQKDYDEYKEKCQAASAKEFVNAHKKEPWFRERYDPEIRKQIRQRLYELRREIYTQWQGDLETGVFDEFTQEGIYKSDSDGQGGMIEKEEGETAAAAEVLGVGDLVPSKGGDIRNDAIYEPALLIKTIAPHVSRKDVEIMANRCLGEGPGGFRWLSLSDANPSKKFHRIGWIILNPGEFEVGKPQEESNDAEEDGEAQEETGDNSSSSAENALDAVNGQVIGEEGKNQFTVHVGIHSPTATNRKKALWDLFSAPERIWRDLQFARRIAEKFENELGQEHINGCHKIEERVEELKNSGMLQQTNLATSGKSGENGEADLEEGEEGEDGDDEEKDDEELLANKKKLDLIVEYLRRVFNFCLYCVFESDSIHELTRKCSGGHLRRPRASLTTAAKDVAKASANAEEFPLKKGDTTQDPGENSESPVVEKRPVFQRNNLAHQQLQRGFNWVKTYEEKIFQVIQPETINLKKLGGQPFDEAVNAELEKHVKQEDEMKWRCKAPCEPACAKLFKGYTFWKKHVEKRHQQWYEGITKEIDEINQYVMDPAHVTSSKGDASSNGHFPQPHHMQSGTPRGFNLAQMNPAMMNMPPNPTGFNFGPYPMPMPMAYGQQGMPAPTGRGGPIRNRGGRNNNNRNATPYDRPGGRGGGNPGWGGNQGRPGGTQQQRFPDAADSGAPREATSGRQLRSYEDLDDVGDDQEQDGQDGNLDY